MTKEQIVETLWDGRIWLLVFAIFAHNMTNSLQTTYMGIIIKGFTIRLIRRDSQYYAINEMGRIKAHFLHYHLLLPWSGFDSNALQSAL